MKELKVSKEQIKDWLDAQIGINILQSQELVLTEKEDIFDEDEIVPDVVLKNISSCAHIHLTSDSLRVVADVMKLPIEVKERKITGDLDYKYELMFFYNGYKFFALEREDEYKRNGELA